MWFRFWVLQFSDLEVEAEAKGRVVVYASSPTLNMNDLSYSYGPCQIFAFTAWAAATQLLELQLLSPNGFCVFGKILHKFDCCLTLVPSLHPTAECCHIFYFTTSESI